MLAFKKIAFLCVLFLLGASQVFAFTATNGEVSFTRLLYGSYGGIYDNPGEKGGNVFVAPWGNATFNWKISGQTNLIKQYSITFQCAPVKDYSKPQSKFYSYTIFGQADSFDWEVDQDSRNYVGAPKNCFCKAFIIAQGETDSLYGEPKPLGEAVTDWFRICEKPEIIKPWIQLLPAERKEDGTLFNLELLSKGNDNSKNPNILFKIFPRDILFEENEKNLIILKPNNPSAVSSLEVGRWLSYYNPDDQATRPMLSILLKNLRFVNNNYCYQAQATNSRGTTVTPAMCFGDQGKIINFPKVANKSVIPTSNNSAYITGSLISTGNSPELYFWVLARDYYDPDKNNNTITSGTDFKATKVGNYQFKIDGLRADTTYCYYTTARNEAGFASTENHNVLDCFTMPGKDWVKTLPSSYVEVGPSFGSVETKFIATVYSVGAGNKNLNLDAKGWFEYDLKSNLPKDISKIDLPKTTSKISFKFNPYLDGKGKNFMAAMPSQLLANKEYCYRAVVENSLGIRKKGNLECFSFGGKEAVASVPEGIKFVTSPNGSTIQKVVLKGNVVYPRNVQVAYFIWQKGIQDLATHKTTYKQITNWTATTKISPSNGNWASSSNTFYGEISNLQPGEKYCYKAVSHYNQDWMTAYYPLDESHLHCFVVPFRPVVETYDADLGADLSIVKLQGKIKDTGFNNFWTDDGKYNIGQILYEKQIILERAKSPLPADTKRLQEINGAFDDFRKKYCDGIACGADVYFNVYPNNISVMPSANKEELAKKANVLTQFAIDTAIHTNLEYFSYQVSNGVFKKMISSPVVKCVRYECGTEIWVGDICQKVIYTGSDCNRKGNSSCSKEGRYCSAISATHGNYCEWSSFNDEKEKCELYRIVFSKGTICPATDIKCTSLSYDYKARAKNAAWYDNASVSKSFVLPIDSIPYGQKFGSWGGCVRSSAPIYNTISNSGCADTAMTMGITYWYKNNQDVKIAWDKLIKKYLKDIKAWEAQQDSDCKNPGNDYYTPNPFTFLYIAREAKNLGGDYAYGALGRGGDWPTEKMTKLLQDINLSPVYLTGKGISSALSFDQAVDSLGRKKVLVLREYSQSQLNGGSGHWLYFDSYDPFTKTINGFDSANGMKISFDRDKYSQVDCGTQFTRNDIDNWGLEPNRYPILSSTGEVQLRQYDSNSQIAVLEFWTTVERVGDNDDEINISFSWYPVSDTGNLIPYLNEVAYPISTQWSKIKFQTIVSTSQKVQIAIKDGQAYCYFAKGENSSGYISKATAPTCFKIKNGELEKVIFTQGME